MLGGDWGKQYLLLSSLSQTAVQCERKPLSTPLTGNQANESFVRDRTATNSNPMPYVRPTFNCVPQAMPTSSVSNQEQVAQVCREARSPEFSRPYPESQARFLYQGTETGVHQSILSSEYLDFKLNPPSLAASTISMDYIYELATRLLFLSVDWARSIPAFRSLERADQLALLQYTWSDVFLFGVAQCSNAIPLSALLTFAATHLKCGQIEDTKPASVRKGASIFDKIMTVKDLVFSLERLQVDQLEYAYLKAVVMFNPGKSLCISKLSLVQNARLLMFWIEFSQQPWSGKMWLHNYYNLILKSSMK